MIPEAGQKFGPYEILSRLGGGAMGMVFRAWDSRLHREVAIKLLHDEFDMPGMRERFLQEARAASALNHPHISTIFDIGEQDGEPYMVMELLVGETLKERLSRGTLSADDIVRYAQDVADALSAAHAKGIVHRDIKPANIFLIKNQNGRPQAKVLDFGLAKIGLAMSGGRASRALDLTLAGSTVGTISYMSPEQARGLNLDARSDLFSLGVMMYEMATGHVPFPGATSALIFVQLLNHAPDPPREWNDSIPRELERVILKLLTKDRDGRYQTANELSGVLRKIQFKTGGWLKKATPAVPLGRASDPVARGKRHVPDAAPEAAKHVHPVKPVSSDSNMLIRPVARMAQKDIGTRGDVVHDDRLSSKDSATEIAPKTLPTDGVNQNNAAVPVEETGAVENDSPADNISVPARNRSPIMRVAVENLVGKPASAPVSATVASKDDSAAEIDETHVGSTWRNGWRLGMVVMLAAAIAGGLIFLILEGGFRPVLLQPGDTLLLTVIQNKTDDKTLDGVAIQGLELILRQSHYLSVMGGDAYRAGLRQAEGDAAGGAVSNRRLAQMVGAKAYLYGELKGSGAPYTISVEVLNTGSNDKLTSVEETANGKEQLAAALDRLANKLRVNLGESDRVVAKTNSPLEGEGTSQVEALNAYAMAGTALQGGRVDDAIAAYQKALIADPKFAAVHVQLAWLYRAERSEVAAADEAGLGLAASENGSTRLKLLAQFCQSMNGSGDYARAAVIMRQFKDLYPHDGAGSLGMARLLRAQGQLPEALQAAQRAYAQNPYGADAYDEAEVTMIGMDRYQGALQLEEQARHLGVVRGGGSLAAAYLAGDAAVLQRETAAVQKVSFAADVTGTEATHERLSEYGLYLDNQGRMTAGADLWRLAGAMAGRNTAFHSTQAYMLAMGALDRAMVNTCSQASGFEKSALDLPRGQVANFNAGMAAALCGDTAAAEKAIASLKQNFPQSTAVTGYYVADLQAATALAAKKPKDALAALSTAAEYDRISLTPYLRGLAHLGTGEAPLAIADFQTILDHRGAAFVAGSNVYPMAQIGLARAYVAIGDNVNSTAAYRRFLELWHNADLGQALMSEAAARAR